MAHNKEHGEVSGTSRRGFIKFAVPSLIGAAITAANSRRISKALEGYANESFAERVEAEKALVLVEIRQGLQNQKSFSQKLITYNNLVEKSQKFPKDSDKHKSLQNEARGLNLQWPGYWIERGNLRVGLLHEANEYANDFLSNSKAVENLAVARMLYREEITGFGDKELRYHHNCAFAYLELGKLSQELVKGKMITLFEYAENNNLRISDIPQEQIIYALGDGDFDFSLTSKKVEKLLNKLAPDWRNFKDTHSDRSSYLQYNNLSSFTIFELNRLKSVLVRLSDTTFTSSVFKARDLDLQNNNTEYGGVIPKPGTGEGLEVIPGMKEEDNSAYVLPHRSVIRLFGSASAFHFHATKAEEPEDVRGPSGSDNAFFGPGVVFTSVDRDTILAHFYTSREYVNSEQKREYKNVVVSLGSIKNG